MLGGACTVVGAIVACSTGAAVGLDAASAVRPPAPSDAQRRIGPGAANVVNPDAGNLCRAKNGHEAKRDRKNLVRRCGREIGRFHVLTIMFSKRQPAKLSTCVSPDAHAHALDLDPLLQSSADGMIMSRSDQGPDR